MLYGDRQTDTPPTPPSGGDYRGGEGEHQTPQEPVKHSNKIFELQLLIFGQIYI